MEEMQSPWNQRTVETLSVVILPKISNSLFMPYEHLIWKARWGFVMSNGMTNVLMSLVAQYFLPLREGMTQNFRQRER